jgi:hypothetical protein
MSAELVELACGGMAAFSAIMVAVINRRSKRAEERSIEREERIKKYEDERDKREEARAKLRRRETMLLLQMVDATAQLSDVSANALTNGHNNGNVERARDAFEKATQEYENFKREVAAGAF